MTRQERTVQGADRGPNDCIRCYSRFEQSLQHSYLHGAEIAAATKREHGPANLRRRLLHRWFRPFLTTPLFLRPPNSENAAASLGIPWVPFELHVLQLTNFW